MCSVGWNTRRNFFLHRLVFASLKPAFLSCCFFIGLIFVKRQKKRIIKFFFWNLLGLTRPEAPDLEEFFFVMGCSCSVQEEELEVREQILLPTRQTRNDLVDFFEKVIPLPSPLVRIILNYRKDCPICWMQEVDERRCSHGIGKMFCTNCLFSSTKCPTCNHDEMVEEIYHLMERHNNHDDSDTNDHDDCTIL